MAATPALRSRLKHCASSLQIVHCTAIVLVHPSLYLLCHISWCINVLFALAGSNVSDLETTETIRDTAQDVIDTGS